MNRIAHITIRCLPVLFVLPIGTALGDDYAINWYTIDGGGGIGSTGGSYTLSGTIGQPDASATAMAGGTYTLTGGFWAATWPACSAFAPGDFDRDCDVDTGDFNVFAGCAAGPELPFSPGCTLPTGPEGRVEADFDGDHDVDHDDFGVFQRCYSGLNVPADPGCGG